MNVDSNVDSPPVDSDSPRNVEATTRRWLYRGRRPNWVARGVNRAWATAVSLGFGGSHDVTLEVRGRITGKIVPFPLVVAEVDGQRYLVSMLGDNVQWVRNVRAAGGRVHLRSGKREAVQLVEVPIDERAPIIKAYLDRAFGARPHIPVDKDAPLAAFAAIAERYPVFRVTRAVQA